MTEPETIRLNKFLAKCGLTSRRGADQMVFDGRVTVNNVLADSPGQQITAGKDKVEVDGKKVSLSSDAQGNIWIMYKPIQIVTTAKDPQGRKTVLDILPEDIRSQRPYPVGRLDYFSEGLLLVTTDGDLCHRLTHPSFHQPKVYEVIVRGTVSKEAMDTMRAGMTLREGEKLAPVTVRPSKPEQGRQQVELTLNQGINRQIRRMFRDFDMTILSLKRTKQGPLSLGGLKPGEFRELTETEKTQLLKEVELT